MPLSRFFRRLPRKAKIAVDLVRLLPGGENGGVKPAVFAFLDAMSRREGSRVSWVFLANEATLEDVRKLARSIDRIWCSHLSAADPEPGSGPDRVDSTRLVEAGVDLLYNPFGADRVGRGRLPFVSLLIDLLHREVPEALPPEEIEHREAFFADACSRAAAIQVISEDVGERLAAAYGLEPGRRFRTYLPLQAVDGPAPAAEVQSLVEGRYFIYPANLWPHKNHSRLVEAFRLFVDRLSPQEPPWFLVLTGAGPTSGDWLDQVIVDHRLGDGVIRAGYLDRARYLATLRGATGLVYPSLNEGFGIPILEAQQLGVPVACSGVSALPEVAGAGARYFDPRNPVAIAEIMAAFARDEALRESLVREGKKNLRRFDFGREAERFAVGLRAALH